jgi:hypothetical protein
MILFNNHKLLSIDVLIDRLKNIGKKGKTILTIIF